MAVASRYRPAGVSSAVGTGLAVDAVDAVDGRADP
jgi:hypothetical protein